jgi:ATPase subunit of ABC transporter with duplicated ATPase domains
MKKCNLLLIVIFLIALGSSFQRINAQEKTKAEQEKEDKIQQSIEQQKKAMADQKKAQFESQQSRKARYEVEERINDDAYQFFDSTQKDRVKVFMAPRGNRPYNIESFTYSGPNMDALYGHMIGGDAERTTWDFSKSLKENTFSKDYSFDVEKTAKSVVMSVNGDCKSGEIRIKIIMPNGKSYSDILIDESGNLNWRKSFTISETENQDKTGDWKFQISSAKATGYFKISLQTF